MKGAVSVCLIIQLCVFLHSGNGVSTKVDFEEDAASSKEEEDVEVKHTIVVSTKLKNNGNRRGLHGGDDPATLTYNIGRNKAKEDSGEVPIVKGYKAVDTTQIRTPDTRFKPTETQPTSIFINRNIRDDYDIYPNLAINPGQWKPSTYFNNINWWTQEPRDISNTNFARRIDRPYQNDGKLHRKLAEDSTKEFYCRKCRELSGKACQMRSYLETTTSKMKIDGKLAKLN